MPGEPLWPVGSTFYSQQRELPWFGRTPEPTVPYRDWGQSHPARMWLGAADCRAWPSGAGQSSDEQYLRDLASAPGTPTEARPYLARGDWPPEPGSREYSDVIRRQFIDRLDEQHYLNWWYENFTSDSPRYTLPPIPTAAPSPPPARPPRDWPAQAPPSTTPTDEPGATITTTGEPRTEAERPTPWGWIIGGGAALLLIGGSAAYLVTRPRRRKG